MNKGMQDVLAFNADPKIDLPEKLSLYLSGIAYLAQEMMKETNATTLEVKSEMSRDGFPKHVARFSIEPLLDSKGG